MKTYARYFAMQAQKHKYHTQGGLLVLILGSFSLLLFGLSRSPDLNLSFSRQVSSHLEIDRLERNISSITRWPGWFFSLSNVELIESDSKIISQGSILKLKMDPKKGKKKRFELTVKVTAYIPHQKLHLTLLDDSSGRLVRLFDHLDWIVEIKPNSKGSLIQGKAIAHTRHWRSRFFGRISEKILMNQIFYPNLVKLAELKQPFSVDLPESQGLAGPSI